MGIGANVLWYKHPAKEWVEALPLGNGSLGAMVYSGVEKESVYLNLDTLWSGYSHGYTVENKVEHFKKARELAMSEKYIESRDYIEENFVGDDCEWYQLMGKLIISSRKHLCPKKFRRELDISTAVAKTDFVANSTNYTREAFVSFPNKVFVYKMTSDGENKLDFTIMVDSELKNTVTTDENTYTMCGICPTHIKNERVAVYSDGEKEGIRFCCSFKIVTDGNVSAKKTHLCVSDATNAEIYLSIESNFESWDKLTYNSKKDYKSISIANIEKAVSDGYDTVKAAHIEDYSSYYNRVSIDLGNSKKDNVPTNRRLHEFLHSKNNDNDLYCLLFNYGRYLTISASRKGSQAMNLQGIWTYKMCSPWRSNYTTNINTEMNYWPTLTCSLPEMNEPLVEFVKGISQSGQEVAEKYYGARGFCCHHNVDLWRITTPSKGNPVWSFWSMAGAWLSRHLYEQYEYTQDKDFLENTAYPIMLSAARFCLDMLIDDGNGYLIFAPSTSPENEYKIGQRNCSVNKTTFMTMGIVRDLFLNVLHSSEVLENSNDVVEEIKEKYEKLLPFGKGSKGQLLEWYDDVTSFDAHHRHVSHLYSLYPANIIDVERTPELVDAAIKTLEMRGDNGTGWSLGWKINFWARLRNPEKLIKLVDNQLRYIKPRYRPGRGGTFPNMFDAHPPFQIDGNFGATSGIAQAFMQSYENTIIILPALPAKWATGHIYGLTAKGNVKVDIDWENGKLTKLTLDGKGTFNVQYNSQKVTVELDGKKDVEF